MSPTRTQAQTDEEFEALLDFLRRNRGFDFTGYKRSSLMRRVRKRMQTVGLDDFADYIDHLEVHPDEFGDLFNTILINVTAFWRDPESWQFLADEILPRILRTSGLNEQIRVWSVGCASGEEAYTLAMLLTEAMGVEGFRERVKIYATDVDEEALVQARHADYTAEDLEPVPEALCRRYFENTGGHYVFRSDLRRSIIFGRHDLIQDAPISRLNLLVCRNTLMYFNAETQSKILARFHFALNDNGYLFLGKAEMLLTHAALFTPVELRHRIFARVPKPNLGDRVALMAEAGSVEPSNQMARFVRLREAAFDAANLPQIVVDLSGTLVMANDPARLLFGLIPRDLGRPFFELSVSFRPLELRPVIERAYADRRAITVLSVEHPVGGELHYFDVQVIPLLEDGTRALGVAVCFADVTRTRAMQDDVQRFKQELETAYEELQSTNEELETTNEELQSTVEELETTNEELQSTNEELETMNEELQSTNEELETMNNEMARRTDELNLANAFQASILSSLRLGVVVLGRDFSVLSWNPRAEDLWGLREEEVRGTSFFSLDIGLPVGKLAVPIRACISGDSPREELVIEAVNRRGKKIQTRLECVPLLDANHSSVGALLWMDELEEGNSG